MTKAKAVRGWHVSVRYMEGTQGLYEFGGYGPPEPAWRVGEERQIHMEPGQRPRLCAKGYHAWLNKSHAASHARYLAQTQEQKTIVVRYVEVSGYPRHDGSKVVGRRRKVLAERVYDTSELDDKGALIGELVELARKSDTILDIVSEQEQQSKLR